MDEKNNEQQISQQELLEEAVQKYLPSAEAGDPIAQYDLACCYYQGNVFDKSLYWWEQAAEKGVNLAWVRLGVQYADGLGTDKDEGKALDYIWKAVKGDPDDASALCYLGMFYEQGIGMEANQEQAITCYRQAAEKGDPMAHFVLAMCYFSGKGVEEDPKTAMEWATKSADLGYAEAQYFLGLQYYLGELTEQDMQLSVRYLQAAMKGGSVDAGPLLTLVEKEIRMQRQIQDVKEIQAMLDEYESFMTQAAIEQGWDPNEEWEDDEEN